MKGTSLPFPEGLGEHAQDVLAGRVRPVPARDAATVAIVREGSGGAPEVYMLRRKASMAFAAGAFVFPGGSVDPRDADHEIDWAGPTPAEWGEIFGASERTALQLVCAAVRETFEESGVLLAGPDVDSVVADTTGDDWEADRLALIDKSLSFADFLRRRRLVLRADLLRPWGHWITPEIETRRFDTRFFVAALPPGQRTRDVGGEADKVTWIRPADALRAARDGEIMLMPPTRRTVAELSAFDTVADILATRRQIVTVMPAAVQVNGEVRLIIPGGTA